MRGEEFDRDVDELLVVESNDDASLARHRSVDGVPREEVAKNRVLAIRCTATDFITRMEITQRDRNAFGFEIRLNFFAQKEANVFEFDVAGSVARASINGEQCPVPSAIAITLCDFVSIRCFSEARKTSSLKAPPE